MAIVPKLKIETAKTAELIPYAGNAKEHPEWQIDQIVASIEQFGMDDPIAVWTNEDGGLEIVEGHGRLMACKKLGITDIPIIRLDHLDDEARRAYMLVHNKLTMNTNFDLSILEQEISDLPDFEWADLGFLDFEDFSPSFDDSTENYEVQEGISIALNFKNEKDWNSIRKEVVKLVQESGGSVVVQ